MNTHTAPSVEVKNTKVHTTHEASIDSFNSKQLQTLMSKGLKEDKAVKLIIESFLN
ncbi:MAG: SufD family Fe-S cluster assembly protein [Actinobacteria bacterium]|nr:SufD family Fe-S cluster assembly protein [Actinomycetota bacterium]MBL7123845.1 SufD family Fe-S cluster assembly protein [Actinomycetota bacterium]